ncbi:transposase domain-containing protein [Stenotrophomonas sp. 364]|uniref:transposase domain-containing protein n=1 Tax=Stenotrophomonas sp. 364 TaxID=2691571 RepID=UPI001316BB0B|nr:transposase domain-containing protein [Stenotrophomonas sp. 364]QHB72914.1 hypothetical protein GQ674_17175 [Stenotrophomonas sp. 364]
MSDQPNEALFDLATIASALSVSKRAAEMRAAKDAWVYQSRSVRGGSKRYYAVSALPAQVQAALYLHIGARPADVPILPPPRVTRSRKVAPGQAHIMSAWQRYEALPESRKAIAHQRLRALQAVESLVADGTALMEARRLVVARLRTEGVRGGSMASLGRWAAEVNGVEKQHRLALLVPHYVGRTSMVSIPPDAWDLFKSDYLRVEAPTATSCYERVQRVCAARGWPAIPSLKTFERRIRAEMPPAALILARQGRQALARAFPAQQRDRSMFRALEAVNADGHRFDVFVRWPDGSIARPVMIGVQDLYSGKLLGHRVAATESADLARLAFRDVVARYGIPEKVWLDNGRGFASKLLTGGAPNRFRFRIQPDDPIGVLTSMGCEVHWASPYHGQAKPIERAWRDLCDRVARHPACAGAYTGNTPTAKPENHGSRAVALDDFIRLVDTEVLAHNAREGRRSRVCGGQRSFDQAFASSYQQFPVRRATGEQLRQLMLAAERVTSDPRDGCVRLGGNRYWSASIARHAGQKLMLRFDPEQLHASIEVYALSGVHLGTAECIAAVGFADTDAAREHARAKRQFVRAAKQQLAAERRMKVASVAAQLPGPIPETLPPPGVVAPLFGQARARSAAPAPLRATGTDSDRHQAFSSLMERLANQHAPPQRRPPDQNE